MPRLAWPSHALPRRAAPGRDGIHGQGMNRDRGNTTLALPRRAPPCQAVPSHAKPRLSIPFFNYELTENTPERTQAQRYSPIVE